MSTPQIAPTMGSLFDGIGGFPLAAVRHGIIPLWASEIEAFPIEVTKRHFPVMVHVGDITKLNGSTLPPVNLICGGSPCQDLSIAGARAGLSGARSGLFMEQIRIVKELRDEDRRRGRTGVDVRPRYMVWENVPGAFSSGEPKGEDFRIVLEEICRVSCDTVYVPRSYTWDWQPAGAIRVGDDFSLAWRVFDTQYWPGTPQRRKRIYLVADFAGGSAAQILFEQNRLPGYPSSGGGTRQGIAANAGESTASSKRADRACGALTAPMAFAQNQRDEVRDLHDVAGALAAQPGMKQQTFVVAGFSAGAGKTAGSIGYHEELAPTLRGGQSGNMMPSVLCLNDQGGQIMDVSLDIAGTLRSQEHGHQPSVYENHGIDARYKKLGDVAPTMSARYGTGGNNVPLVEQASTYCIAGNIIDRQPENGGNGFGYQANVAYTITTADRHAVFSRQRVDLFKSDEVASTESARQHKDATDLILHENCAENTQLIRRLTPLECERLQGFPDGWTALPGASDASRYKALGNSVAIPCVEYVMQGIAWAMADR